MPFVEKERSEMMDETGSFKSQLCSWAASDSHWCIRIWGTRRRRSGAENPPASLHFLLGVNDRRTVSGQEEEMQCFPACLCQTTVMSRHRQSGAQLTFTWFTALMRKLLCFWTSIKNAGKRCQLGRELDRLEVIGIGNGIKHCRL